MRRPTRHDPPAPGTTLYWLLAALVWTLLPHLFRLPVWITGLTLALGVGRLLIYRRGLRLPPRWLLIAIALAGAFGVIAQYGTLLGRDAGVALLSLMLAFKLMEMRTLRDTMLVVFLGYFLVITNLFYSQEILLALYLLVAVWMLTATLLELTHPDNQARHTLRYAGQLLLQSLPVMLVLFLLFPRISGPLWGLPKDAVSGTTGLSDRMEPGSISQLSQSNAVAFRVEFDEAIPPSPLRYWRGPIFWYTDGRRWQPRPLPSLANQEPVTYQARGTPIHYTVTLEPHQQRWLFAMDLPVEVETAQRITRDFQVLADRMIRDVRRYRAASYSNYTTPAPSLQERQDALQLPRNLSHRVDQLAKQWQRQSDNPRDVVQLALHYFRDQPFVYTLNPPLLGNDPVDQFLFETRRGFCEHYASAFTTLMRAAGIPARVVTGYQGGEVNPLGNYLIVRQSDAHAWSEVYLPDQGWVRVDPTAAVAPERVERGIDNAFAEIGAPIQFQLPAANWLIKTREQLRFLWDGVQNGWNQWVLGYGPELQRQLMELIGLGRVSWQGIVTVMTLTVTGLLVWIAYGLLRSEQRPVDPLQQSYRLFCRKLAGKGITKLSHEGPLDFARRVSLELPDQEPKVFLITRLYIAMRYGDKVEKSWLPKLQEQVRTFRP